MINIIIIDEQEEVEKPVVNPKANWLSQKFSQSEINLRMKKRTQLKEGVHIQRKLGDITNQLEDVLDTIGASYYFSRKRDRLMVRITKGLIYFFHLIKRNFMINNEIKRNITLLRYA